MSAQPVWIVNGGSTTMSSPTPQPTGSYLPVWVVNATDTVSKLSTPTTINVPTTAAQPAIQAFTSGELSGGLFSDPFITYPSVRNFSFYGSSFDIRYSMHSHQNHIVSVASTSEWSTCPPFLMINHGSNSANLSKVVREFGVFSMYMPIGQSGFETKSDVARIHIPSNSIFNVCIRSYARTTSGCRHAKSYITGYVNSSGSVIVNATAGDETNVTSGSYFTHRSTQNSANKLMISWITTAYTGSICPELVWGNVSLDYALFVA